MKEAAYKGMVRPILEYGSSVWDPHTGKLQEELEKVQNHATRFVTRNYVYETGCMTDILGQLKWESLKKRRKDNRLRPTLKIFLFPLTRPCFSDMGRSVGKLFFLTSQIPYPLNLIVNSPNICNKCKYTNNAY